MSPGSAGVAAAVEFASGYPAQVAANTIRGRARGFREGQAFAHLFPCTQVRILRRSLPHGIT